MTEKARQLGHLCITEKWIRQHLNLQVDSLADEVKSLSLPGSYSEKITHLGRSLVGFVRLKYLDLSRNAIESLEGLEQLKHLETLNLYYNNVASLKELFRLKHNTKLKELDIRLNPVTKNEPDYRLFLVHMLVNLRKLDDRSVRDSERKAALMHFDSDQAQGFSEHQHHSTDHKDHHHDMPKHISSRTDLVQSLAPRPTTLEDDTDELLELIAKTDSLLTPAKHNHPTQTPLQESETLFNKSPGFSPLTYGHSHLDHGTPKTSSVKSHLRSRHTNLSDSLQRNLEFKDEYQAYSNVVVKGNFTPAPAITVTSEVAPIHTSPEIESGEVDGLLRLIQMHVCGDTKTLQLDSAFKSKLKEWLSSHTLTAAASPTHKEAHDELKALQEQVEHRDSLLLQKDSDLANMQERLHQCESEAAVLGGKLQALTAELEEVRKQDTTNRQMKQLLNQANKDLAALRQRVQSLHNENSTLKASVDLAPSNSRLVKLEKNFRFVEAENSSLHLELKVITEKHKQDIQNTAQIQQLAAMLQESHRALVATNDHLLQELEDTKQRHMQEVTQMNLNYKQLRKTIEFMRSTTIP